MKSRSRLLAFSCLVALAAAGAAWLVLRVPPHAEVRPPPFPAPGVVSSTAGGSAASPGESGRTARLRERLLRPESGGEEDALADAADRNEAANALFALPELPDALVKPAHSAELECAVKRFPIGRSGLTLEEALRTNRLDGFVPLECIWNLYRTEGLDSGGGAWISCTRLCSEHARSKYPKGVSQTEWWGRLSSEWESEGVFQCYFFVSWDSPRFGNLSVTALDWSTYGIVPEIGPCPLLEGPTGSVPVSFTQQSEYTARTLTTT